MLRESSLPIGCTPEWMTKVVLYPDFEGTGDGNGKLVVEGWEEGTKES